MFEPLLCPLLGLLCIMVPVGHGIWLLLAAIFRTTPRSADPRRRWRRCVRCGTEFVAAEERCPQCDLDPRGAAAAELRDLEAATRAVQALHREGGLDAALCDEVSAASRPAIACSLTSIAPNAGPLPKPRKRCCKWNSGSATGTPMP